MAAERLVWRHNTSAALFGWIPFTTSAMVTKARGYHVGYTNICLLSTVVRPEIRQNLVSVDNCCKRAPSYGGEAT